MPTLEPSVRMEEALMVGDNADSWKHVHGSFGLLGQEGTLDRELPDVARLVAEALGLVWDTTANGYVDPVSRSSEHTLKPDGSNLTEAHWFKASTLKLIQFGALHLEDSVEYRRMASFFSVDESVDIGGHCPSDEAPPRLLAALQARRPLGVGDVRDGA